MLISHQYGCKGFLPTAVCIWYQRHILPWFLILLIFGIVFVLDSPLCLTGTLQADAWHRTAHGFSKGLADYNPKSILCSLAVPMYHYPPRKWSSQKTATVLFQLKRFARNENATKRTLPLTFWSNFFHALFICPRVFLPRFYLRERTCNAGMRLSKYTGKNLPAY